jgi:hypothetical protein
MSSSNAQPGAQGQPNVTSPTLTSTTHDRIVFKQDEIIVLNKLKVSPNEVASLTRKELNALYHNMRNNLTNTTVEPVAHPANNSTCTPTPSETKQTCPSSPTSVRQSIAATQELITETLTSSKKMLASTDKILSASNELEKKWKEFQESFQKMTNAMVDNIAASLGTKDNVQHHHSQDQDQDQDRYDNVDPLHGAIKQLGNWRAFECVLLNVLDM